MGLAFINLTQLGSSFFEIVGACHFGLLASKKQL
jgi:hypothetical protein